MARQQTTNRRTVLKTVGTGIAASAVFTTPASAGGKGGGIGAFLNEEAALKERPIWDSGVVDKTDESAVEILVGTLTSVDISEELWEALGEDGDPPEQAPFGYDSRAVKVSPGTEVTWTWMSNHHSVTSYNSSAESPQDHGQEFDSHGDKGHTYSHTFHEVGTYLYFCHPHGTPYPEPFPVIGNVPNHVGMRGAVKVVDD